MEPELGKYIIDALLGFTRADLVSNGLQWVCIAFQFA